ncbi:MAG TPA: hypothetical protein VMV90_07105 [Rectinemataceae bacterium]|nr:hypothetical protein [Rectinemataceae bacterium]
MNSRLLAIIVLAVLDIPLYVLLFRLLFRRAYREERRGADGVSSTVRRLPRLGELLDPVFLKEVGGEMKLLLLLFAAAILVLAEYSLATRLLPGLFS